MSVVSTLYILPRALSAKAIALQRRLCGRAPEAFSIYSESEIRTFYEGPVFDPLGIRPGLRPQLLIPSFGLHPGSAPLDPALLLGRLFEVEVDETRSFFGDAIHIIDQPDEQRVDPRFPPFGWSGRSLTGGYALTASPLIGAVVVRFGDAVHNGFISVSLEQPGGLKGADGSLVAPGDFSLPTSSNLVTDAPYQSHALVEVATGRLFDFHYNVMFSNSAIAELLSVNPELQPPPLLFPGVPHGGHAVGHIAHRDRQVTLAVLAQMFLPLDKEANGQPIRMPASKGGSKFREPFPARNSSLHPFIQIFAQSKGADQAARWAAPDQPLAQRLRSMQNQTLRLTCLPPMTNFGDEFRLRNPRLGGYATGMSPLIGDLTIQFGTADNDRLPYLVRLDSPSPAFARRLEPLLKILPPGTHPGLIGLQGYLKFPKLTYLQSELSFCSDPQKVSVGVANLANSEAHQIVLRKFLFVSVMKKLIAVEPRTPTDSWTFVSDAAFALTSSGHLVYRADGSLHIPYPANYGFPSPNGMRMRIGSGSYLTPFAHLFAVESGAVRPVESLKLSFCPSELVRGMPLHAFALSADSEGSGVRWTATWSDGKVQGLAAPGATRHILLDDGTLCIGSSFAPISRPETEIQVWLTRKDDIVNALFFSTDERVDVWMRGGGYIALSPQT